VTGGNRLEKELGTTGRAETAAGRQSRVDLAPEPELTRWGNLKDPALEAEFRADRYERELRKAMRWSAWSAFGVYMTFGIIDFVAVWDVLEVALVLRYLVIGPMALALGVLTMTKRAAQYQQFIGIMHSLMGPALFLTVGELAADPGGLLYTLWGAILFPILVPQLTRLGVRWTLLVSLFALVYMVALDWVVDPRMVWQQLFLIIFFITGCGYGVWMTYTGETAARRSFWKGKIIAWQMDELASEREKSERLLLNVLPSSVAARLRDQETIADSFEEVTVLFADIAGFTKYSAKVSAEQLVSRLDEIFTAFDNIADDLALEKIKTIGDAYMVAAGLPEAHGDGPAAVAKMALGMHAAVQEVNAATGESFAVRVGIHTGPVVAGVIGRRKFIYDIWGDTVNTASRMESHGEVNRIQLSEATAALLDERFELEERGMVELKGKGPTRTFWLLGCSD